MVVLKYKKVSTNLKNRIGQSYSIDTNGIIHNDATGKGYAGTLRYGYRFFKIGSSTYRIHRLVAMAFCPNPDKKKEINHIDGCKSNNKVENLEWCTHKENMSHASSFGLLKPCNGIKHGMCRLSEDDVRWVCERLVLGKGYSKKEFPLHIGRHIVSKIKKRTNWVHISGEYTW